MRKWAVVIVGEFFEFLFKKRKVQRFKRQINCESNTLPNCVIREFSDRIEEEEEEEKV